MPSDRQHKDNPGMGHSDGWSVRMLRMLLESRQTALIILIVAAFYFALFAIGISVYRCPLHQVTGLRCAGCGLSTAILFLMRGDVPAMWHANPFAPYIVSLGVLMVGAALPPERWRRVWIAAAIALERRTRAHAMLLTLLGIFGAWRLVTPFVMPG